MSPGDDTFSAADLEPSPADHRALWSNRLDRVAAVIAVGAAGLWAGGLVALGVFRGIEVFGTLPPTLAAEARASALASFDVIGLGCAAVLLGCEMARSAIAFRRRRRIIDRIRRIGALGLAACAAYLALVIAPGVIELRSAGIVPGLGAHGAELARLEERAIGVRQLEVVLAAVLMMLQIGTLRSREEDDDEAHAAPAPRRPGPTRQGRAATSQDRKVKLRYLDDDEGR